MPEPKTELTVFVASPEDMKEEIKIIDDIVEDVNRIWSKEKNVKHYQRNWKLRHFCWIDVEAFWYTYSARRFRNGRRI
jgi:hypothetical protein